MRQICDNIVHRKCFANSNFGTTVLYEDHTTPVDSGLQGTTELCVQSDSTRNLVWTSSHAERANPDSYASCAGTPCHRRAAPLKVSVTPGLVMKNVFIE